MQNYDEGNSGWLNEDTELPDGFLDDLPKPLFWRVLVAPIKPKEVSKGGIVLAVANLEAQEILNYLGKVVALGPMAGKHERLGGDGRANPDFPKVGDYVAYGRYAGQRLSHKNVRLLVCNDDELLAIVPNPETLQVMK